MKKAAECKSRVFSYGKYAEELKILAKAVKNCEMYAIEKTALLMCDHILFRAIVIPIPGRDGYVTYMREVAKCMSDVRPDIQVLDLCKGKRIGSWCSCHINPPCSYCIGNLYEPYESGVITRDK